jgi:hypothetical protein
VAAACVCAAAAARGQTEATGRGELETDRDSVTFAPTTADLRDPAVRRARDQVLPRNVVKMSVSGSYERFRHANPGLSGAEAYERFDETIELLRAKGMLDVKDKEIVAKSGSGH